MDIDELERILGLLKDTDVRELEWEREGVRLVLKRGPEATQPFMTAAPAMHFAQMPTGAGGAAAAPVAAPEVEGDRVTSPFVGTFYSASSPDSDPFVKEGQVIKKGQVLCIVEAMKLMNEIEAEFDGTVISVLAENAQPVEYGEALFVIRRA